MRRIVVAVCVLGSIAVLLLLGERNLFPLSDAAPPMTASRNLMAVSATRRCAFTTHGAHLIADERGAVCARHDVDADGCCVATRVLGAPDARHSVCASCRKQCCASMERCVACCISRFMDAGDSNVRARFDRCERACRTSSRLLVGGNRFESDFVHCIPAVKDAS